MSKLTDQQIEQLVAWRERGKSYRFIAGQLGVSDSAVHYQCLKHGAISPCQRGRHPNGGPASFVAGNGRTQRRFSPDEDRQLVDLEMEGLSYTAIARKLGRPNTSVRIRLMTLAMHDEIAA